MNRPSPNPSQGEVPEFELIRGAGEPHLLPKGMYALPPNGTVLVEQERLKEVERQREELQAEGCKCRNCAHIQAEPNWCHKCGHRTSQPDWAARLLGELDAHEQLAEKAEAALSRRDNRIAEALYWLDGGDGEAAEAALKDDERVPPPGFGPSSTSSQQEVEASPDEAARAIEGALRAFPETRWDRFIQYGGKARIYGWLDRTDGRADFLLLATARIALRRSLGTGNEFRPGLGSFACPDCNGTGKQSPTNVPPPGEGTAGCTLRSGKQSPVEPQEDRPLDKRPCTCEGLPELPGHRTDPDCPWHGVMPDGGNPR